MKLLSKETVSYNIIRLESYLMSKPISDSFNESTAYEFLCLCARILDWCGAPRDPFFRIYVTKEELELILETKGIEVAGRSEIGAAIKFDNYWMYPQTWKHSPSEAEGYVSRPVSVTQDAVDRMFDPKNFENRP